MPRGEGLPKNYSPWRDIHGFAVETGSMRVPVYLKQRLMEIARELHAEELKKQEEQQKAG